MSEKANTIINYVLVKDMWRYTYTLLCRIFFHYVGLNKLSGEEWVLQE